MAVIATMIEVAAAALAAHPFLHGISPDRLAVLARAASDVAFPVRTCRTISGVVTGVPSN